tara:strand:- start:12171 stop:12416 length:246 start_codon:yes stop_codon:yes gene_type:complete
MGQISKIANGWGKYFKGGASALEQERAKVCEGCTSATVGTFEKLMPDYSLKIVQGLKCGECGCPLSTAIRSKEKTCPLGKW